jgi:hypothetical protein
MGNADGVDWYFCSIITAVTAELLSGAFPPLSVTEM